MDLRLALPNPLQRLLLLRHPLDRESSELRVFLSDLPRCLERIRIAPGLSSVNAVESIDGHARAGRRPFKHSDILSGCNEMTAAAFIDACASGRYSV